MSNILTEKKNYKFMIEKSRKINEIKNNELNKECFDCGSCYPEYISINNGVFICNKCIQIHNKFPKEISLTLKNDLSTLNDKELQYMYFGGNQKLIEFINIDYPELSKFKKEILYQTRAMKYYRDNLNYLVNSGPEPIRPSKEINAYEIIDINNERNNKIYEKINFEGNNKGIYKTKKRNKSLDNKNRKEDKYLIYSNRSKNIKTSRNNKSFRKNHFLDEDNIVEELKRNKSFYKEMNKLFKDEEETTKKEYNYYRKKRNKFISNNINNIKLNNTNKNFVKYNSKTNDNNTIKYQEYPIENVFNNNYYNLSTTKNIFMFTPIKDNIIYDYNQISKNNLNKLDKLTYTNNNDIYSKPKLSQLINSSQKDELILPLKINTARLNLTNINNDNSTNNQNMYNQNNNYISTNTFNRKNNQNKTKEIFANLNINKNNHLQNNNLMRIKKRNEIKKENIQREEELNKRNNNTLKANNKFEIKEIRIENIRKKLNTNVFNDANSKLNNITTASNIYQTPSNQNYKKIDISNLNINKIRFGKRHNFEKEEKNKLLNYTQTENKGDKKIKNLNIFFGKNKNENKIKMKIIDKRNIELDNKIPNSSFNIGTSTIQKYSIRNKYKMKRKQENI